jgi:hypothetical protein
MTKDRFPKLLKLRRGWARINTRGHVLSFPNLHFAGEFSTCFTLDRAFALQQQKYKKKIE